MTTLVTGGNGWLPSHLVRRLARRGERVVSYDLMPPDDLLRDFLGDAIAQVTFVEGDVTDGDRLRKVALGEEVDAVVHAAVITPRRDREVREPARILDVNLGGTVNALEAARSIPSLRRFVYVSSGAVMGSVSGVTEITEETPAQPENLYAITKYASERTALRYRDLFGMPVVAMRPPNVFGPMERVTPGYAGATELREMLRIHASGEPVRVTSLAGPWLDWTYVDDVAEGLELGWERADLPHALYNITGGELFSIGDVLAAFARHVPGFRYEEAGPERANYRVAGDAPGPVPSGARLLADTGWRPRTTFDEGMRRYLAWVAEHGPQ